MNEPLRITGTAEIAQKNEGNGVCGLFPCIMTIINKKIAVNADIVIESATERGYIPPALHRNEQY